MTALSTVATHTAVGASTGIIVGMMVAASTLSPIAGEQTAAFAFKFCSTVFGIAGAAIGLCSGLITASTDPVQIKDSPVRFYKSQPENLANESKAKEPSKKKHVRFLL